MAISGIATPQMHPEPPHLQKHLGLSKSGGLEQMADFVLRLEPGQKTLARRNNM